MDGFQGLNSGLRVSMAHTLHVELTPLSLNMTFTAGKEVRQDIPSPTHFCRVWGVSMGSRHMCTIVNQSWELGATGPNWFSSSLSGFDIGKSPGDLVQRKTFNSVDQRQGQGLCISKRLPVLLLLLLLHG